MTQSLHERAAAAFEAACELSEEERAAFLSKLAAEDERLAAQVERLLAHDSDSIQFLGEREVASGRDRLAALLDDEDDPLLGESEAGGEEAPTIGPYRVLRRIGEGGMGVVYEAEQDSPRRRVALKVSRPILGSDQRLIRFRQETEVLGRLEHPGIAKVFSAGTFERRGAMRPYFAMEFVEGESVTTFAERAELPLAGRLELVAAICDAVQHAHEKGVVHRDLKPDNVLVRADGRPVVLDFGVARLNDASTVLTTHHTSEGEILGTLAYMAPEQLGADPDAITARCDVYALGVLLFELLTGRLPHDLSGLPLGAVIRLLSDHPPPPLRAIRPDLAGDVDTIVGKALAFEPARRYASAAALSADLRAFVQRRPISARPPTRTYRARRFVARNRGLTLAVGAAFGALALGLVGTLAFARNAAHARAEADAAALEARRSQARVVSRLMAAARRTFEDGDAFGALDLLEEVPSEFRGWGWRLFASQLPNRLDLPVDMEADPLLIPEPRRPFWRWLDDERLFGLNQVTDSVWIVDRNGQRLSEAAAGLGLDEVGDATGTGLVMATRDDEALLIDLERDTVLGAWPAVAGVPPGHVDDAGRVVAFYSSDRTVAVHAGERPVEQPVELAARSTLARTQRPSVLVTPDGRRVLVSRLEEVEVYDVETESSAVLLAEPPHTMLTVHLLGTGWATFEWTEGERKSAAWRRFDGEGRASEPVAANAPLEYVQSSEFTRDGELVCVNSGRGAILFDVASGNPVRRLAPQDEQGFFLHEGAFWARHRFAPGGSQLLVTSFDVAPLVLPLAGDETELDRPLQTLDLTAHVGLVRNVALSHDGSLLATMGLLDPLVRLWDARTGEPLATLERNQESPAAQDGLLAFTPDDERLVLTTAMGETQEVAVVEWELATGRTRIVEPSEPVVSGNHVPVLDTFLDVLNPAAPMRLSCRAAWDGNLATAIWLVSEDWGWKAEPPEIFGQRWRLAPLPGADPRDEVQAFAIAASNERFAVASVPRAAIGAFYREGTVAIRSTGDGELLEEIYMDPSPWSLAWSPDGSRLAVGCARGEVKLLETEFLTVQHTFQADTISVLALAWFPDGERLLTASHGGRVRVWDPRSPETREAESSAWQRARSRAFERIESGDSESSTAGATGLDSAAERIERILRVR